MYRNNKGKKNQYENNEDEHMPGWGDHDDWQKKRNEWDQENNTNEP